MDIHLEKLDPVFRNLTDLLFFSNRIDLNTLEFNLLYTKNQTECSNYIWDRFVKGSEIYWDNGNKFWHHRLSLIWALNDKPLINKISSHIEKNMFSLARTKFELNNQYDIAYIQFIQYCRIKHENKESLLSIRNYLTEVPSHIRLDKLIDVIGNFVPYVYKDLIEYSDAISKKIIHSSRNFDLLVRLEREAGITFKRDPIINLSYELLMERSHNERNKRAFFTIINDPQILAGLKNKYHSSNECKDKLKLFLEDCEYSTLEEHHLKNIKNIISLDESLADEIAIIYTNKLLFRSTGHKRANVDRIIRMLKTFPNLSKKKVLAHLAANNKMSDIKYLLNTFPDLKNLAVFI